MMYSLDDVKSSLKNVSNTTEWIFREITGGASSSLGLTFGSAKAYPVVDFKFNLYTLNKDIINVGPGLPLIYGIYAVPPTSLTLQFVENDLRDVEAFITNWVVEVGLTKGKPKRIPDMLKNFELTILDATKKEKVKGYSFQLIPPDDFAVIGSNMPQLLTHTLTFPVVGFSPG